ncbi:MAG: TetR/AcrR family transcriptional regulator [Longimicrobiales bacterium]|nr:TetR/AcrR family transcriptional regulator [Longimicrobiales bacterium]
MGLREPRQDRSRRTLARIERAALELIGEQGVEGTSVHEIVERAHSSVGSFYARFEGKEALLRHLETRIWEGAHERWDEAIASRDEEEWLEIELPDLVEAIVRLLLETYRVHARQRRLLETRRMTEGAAGAAADFYRHVRAGLRALLLARPGAIGHPDPSTAVDFALVVVSGALREFHEGAALDDALPVPSDERLVREVTRLVLGYLGADEPEAEHGSQIEFFDIWG